MSRRARKGGGRELEVTVVGIGARGDGLAKLADGTPLFVPQALPGERLRVRIAAKSEAGLRGDILELLHQSPDRLDPTCPNGARCGGCLFQTWAPAAQAAWKVAQVQAAVARAGFDPALVQARVEPAQAGRRRARFHAAGGKLGFRERRSHDIIALGPCQTLGAELRAFWQAVQGLPCLETSAEWTVTATPAGLDIAVQTKGQSPPPRGEGQDLIAALAGFTPLARLTWNGDLLAEIDAPRVDLGGLAPILPPGGFLQPSEGGQAALQALVLAALPPSAHWVADLYCGMGTFAVPLAARGHCVQALESYEPAVAALDAAVRRDPSNRFKIHLGLRNLDRYPLQGGELEGFDAVIFDPPRGGARAQANHLAQSAIPRLVAVSCNPSTWARDAALLREGGYALTAVTPVDQFPQTPHLEMVSLFTRC